MSYYMDQTIEQMNEEIAALKYEISELRAVNGRWEQLAAGVSSTLRGNPLEIEARYRAMEKEIETLKARLGESVVVIENLLAAHEAVLQDRIGYQVDLGEAIHKNGNLQVELNHFRKELEYFCINAIESYELKLPAHKNTYVRAVAGIKGSPATKQSETSEASQHGEEDKEE